MYKLLYILFCAVFMVVVGTVGFFVLLVSFFFWKDQMNILTNYYYGTLHFKQKVAEKLGL